MEEAASPFKNLSKSVVTFDDIDVNELKMLKMKKCPTSNISPAKGGIPPEGFVEDSEAFDGKII